MDKLQPPPAAGSFIHLLGTDRAELTWLKLTQCIEDGRQNELQVDQSIRWSANQENAERQPGEALLLLEVPIHRQESVKAPGHLAEQFPVGDPLPAFCRNRGCLVADEARDQIGWQVLIKKNAHSSARTPLQVPALQQLEPA
jgi:hypothetical protein